ncbi:UPF0721 transmembrane protein [Agaricicola taiwanensis]|uniref:Probable membrane transporter protein n=1 Tax=Agaricicola taiwanensis TaxID=591372 RepID=A0A8J2YKH1_9RHOB|nr:sulfite exporter TauE/SafE family protein [Agaricicola taiwanensis]GGE49849.1 UPF0721 transmembrane protein [Agaricicola taiwanensis]
MEDFWTLVAIGFAAQMIDGALGMAFGLVSTSVMLSLGMPPANASALVHTAEIFTTGASGASHVAAGNLDRKLFWRLLPFGVGGGVLGATVLSSIDGDLIKPFVVAYLAVVGCFVLYRVVVPPKRREDLPRGIPVLGAAGGFLDASGGGGWGPIVTSTLIGNGVAPRPVIGTVNITEFFVTLSISATFLFHLGWQGFEGALGLIIGGVAAAPLAGLTVRFAPTRVLAAFVGVLVIILASVDGYKLITG